MHVSVQGIGVVGGFGTGVTELRQKLLSGTCSRSSVHLANCGEPLDLPAYRADTSRLGEYVPLK